MINFIASVFLLYSTAQDYRFDKPEQSVVLPPVLHEISGITSITDELLACVQDERGVIFFYELVWVKNAPAARPLSGLGWAAFALVQLQGLLGGLRVVLDARLLADVRLGTIFGIFHGCLGQAFLVLLCVIALLTSRWWIERTQAGSADVRPEGVALRRWFLVLTGLIFAQLMIGATMRHQHAGLSIPDFPLAYGRLWPDTSAEAVARYNQQRVEVTTANPITAFQIWLQLVHRLVALVILIGVAMVAWRTRTGSSTPCLRRLARVWLGLILVQVGLGAWTIWSNKAADVATGHVLVGALSLVTGAFGCLISYRCFTGVSVMPGASCPTSPRAEGAPVSANS